MPAPTKLIVPRPLAERLRSEPDLVRANGHVPGLFETVFGQEGLQAAQRAAGSYLRPTENGQPAAGEVLKCCSAARVTDVPVPFPLDVFPEYIRDFVRQTADALSCPPDYVAVNVLGVASSFIGPGRPLQVKPGWEERAVLWLAIVGPTGSMKSPAMDKAMVPAWEYDRKLADKYRTELGQWKAARDRAKADGKKFDKPEPVQRQHVTTDTTVEGLADVLTANPQGVLLYRDELTGWVNALNQYKGGKGSDRQFWLSAWSCQDYTINRRGRPPQKITCPYLPVIGNVPPDMLGDLTDRKGREDGWLDRILFTYPEPTGVRWTDTSAPSDLEQKYVRTCLAIRHLRTGELRLAPAAQKEFARWYDRHNGETGGLRGPWAKLNGYCARLANVLHHLLRSQTPVVSRETVLGAVRLIDYFKDHIRRAHAAIRRAGDDGDLGRLLQVVAGKADRVVRPRDLIAARTAPTAAAARAKLQRLADMGLGEMRAGDRKDEVYFVGYGRPDQTETAGV